MSTHEADDVKIAVRSFILREFLPGEDSEELGNDTPLITGGIIDSVSTLKLVGFIEEHFEIQIAAHEVDAEYLDSVDRIEKLVRSKK